MSRKLLNFHKKVIEDSCTMLSQNKLSLQDCIKNILSSFEDPEEKCDLLLNQLSEENVLHTIKQTINLITQFKNDEKIGTPLKRKVNSVIHKCLYLIYSLKDEKLKIKMYDYSYWNESVLLPMLSLKDNKWFFESSTIKECIEQKIFFVINQFHVQTAKEKCSRDTYYLIKSYYTFKNIENKPFYQISRNKDISNETLIKYFKDGVYLWDSDYWNEILSDFRRELFEFAVKSGYQFRKETEDELSTGLYFIIWKGGLEYIKYVMENYPRKIEIDEFGSSICAACGEGDNIELLRYIVEECNVRKDFWAATHSCLHNKNIKCFEYCVSIGVPINYTRCLDLVDKNIDLLESSSIINDIFGQSKESINVVGSRISKICESICSLTFGEYDETLKNVYPHENMRVALWYILYMNNNQEYKDKLLELCKQDPSIKNNSDITSYLVSVGNYHSLKFLIENNFKVKAREFCYFLKCSLNMFPLCSTYNYTKELEDFINSL
jgi:hypothetical protein